MAWVKVDDQFADHPKMLALGRDRLAATGLWLIGLAYCNRHLTEGFLPGAVVPSGSGRLADRLVEVGLWEPALGGYRVHDFAEYQRSRAEVEADRAAAHAARVAGGKKRAAEAERINGRFAPASEQQPSSSLAGAELDQQVTSSSSSPPAPSRPLPTDTRPGKGNSLLNLNRPDVAFLRRIGWRRLSAEQLRVLDEIGENERSKPDDVLSGQRWCERVMDQAPRGTNPIAYLIEEEHRRKAERLDQARARESEHQRHKRANPGKLAAALAATVGTPPPKAEPNGRPRTELLDRFRGYRGRVPDEALAAQMAPHGLTLGDLDESKEDAP